MFQLDSSRFVPGKKAVVITQGQSRRKDFGLLDLKDGSMRQLSKLKPGFSVINFDISPDRRKILFDRLRENSDLVLIELPLRR